MTYPLQSSSRYQSVTLDAGDTVIDLGTGDGISPFPVIEAADLVVIRVRDGAEELLTLDADYALGNLDQIPGPRIFLAQPAVQDDRIVAFGARPIRRPTDLYDGQRFNDVTLNSEFDNLTIQQQELRRDVDRAWKNNYGVPGGVIASVPEGHFWMADAAGNMVDGGSAADIANAQAYAAEAAAARDAAQQHKQGAEAAQAAAEAAAAIAQVASGAGFPTRAAFVAAVAAGHLNGLSDGQTVSAAGLRYRKKTGATTISDILGWVPAYGVNVAHYGAVADATAGVTGSGTDCKAAFQAAADYAIANGIAKVKIGGCEPGKAFRLGSAISLKSAVEFVGVSPMIDTSVDPRVPKGGTWLYIDHTGHGITFRDDDNVGLFAGGSVLRSLGTVRNQPAPASGWVPNDLAHDFRVEGRVDLIDVMQLNPTKAVLVRSSGVLQTTRHRGQPFLVGVEVERSADTQRFTGTHFWPFWSFSEHVYAYTLDNGIGVQTQRADSLFLTDFFTFAMKRLLKHGDQASHGVGLSELHLNNVYADKAGGGIEITSSLYMARVVGNGVVINSDDDVGGEGNGILIQGAVPSVVNIDGLTVTRAHECAVRAKDAAHTVTITPGRIQGWDRLGNNDAAFQAENGATINLLSLGSFSATPTRRYGRDASSTINLPVSNRLGYSTVASYGIHSTRVTIADDGVAVIPMPAAQMTGNVHLIPASVPANGSPSVELWGRATSSPALTALRNSHPTNFVTTTGVLTGTTGTDGDLTCSMANNGNFYIENRTGAAKSFAVLIVGS